MTAWEARVAGGWLSRVTGRGRARHAAMARTLSALAPTAAFDLAASITLAAAGPDGEQAGRVFEARVLTLAGSPAGWIWRAHRGAFLSLLESLAESAAAWDSPAGDELIDRLGRLLDDDGRRAVPDGLGVSFRRAERLAAAIAADLGQADSRQRSEVARLALARVEAALAAPPEAVPWRITGTSRAVAVDSASAWQAVPFAGLCAPRPSPLLDIVARRFAGEARRDVRTYDRAPLHVAAVGVLLEENAAPLTEMEPLLCSVPFVDLPSGILRRIRAWNHRPLSRRQGTAGRGRLRG